MIEIKGNFWDCAHNYDAIVCTTNGIIKKDGTLVMGKGIAKDFAERYPELPKIWGNGVISNGNVVQLFDNKPICISFPTKTHWKDPSDITLIERSAEQLLDIINILNIRTILLTRPGCGNGNLSWDRQVKSKLLPIFDDRFTVINIS